MKWIQILHAFAAWHLHEERRGLLGRRFATSRFERRYWTKYATDHSDKRWSYTEMARAAERVHGSVFPGVPS